MNSKLRNKLTVAGMSMAMAASMMAGMPVHANGVDTTDTQTYTSTATYDSTSDSYTYSSAWADTSDSTTTDGTITVTYDTTGGTWTDDTTGTSHTNGSYIVTIPKTISYTNMSIGTLSGVTGTYTVNVTGAIPTGDVVTVTAKATTNPTTGSDTITEEVVQGKSTWTASDCFGSEDTSGNLTGTDGTDTYTLSGTAKECGVYSGIITYSASIGDATTE